jgi:hypothetical protein
MADNIKTFEAPNAAPRADDAGAQAYQVEGRHVESVYAQAGQSIGSGIAAAGDAFVKHDELVETADLTNKFAQLDMQTAKDREAAQSTWNPHDTTVPQQFNDAHADALAAIGENLSTDRGKEMFNKMSADYNVSNFNKSIGYQSQAAADDTINSFSQAGQTRAKLALADPTSTGDQIDALKSTPAGPLGPHGSTIISKMVEQTADSGAEGYVQTLLQKPGATLQDVNTVRKIVNDKDGAFFSNMSPQQLLSVNNRLDTIAKTQGNVQSVIAAQTLSAGYKQIAENGGVDNNGQFKSIIDNYQAKTPAETEEFKAKNYRDLDAAIATGQATLAVKSTPDDELKNGVVDLKAKLDAAPAEQAQKLEDQYKAVVEAKKVRDEAFKKDPADWMNQNNDVVKARYNAFAQNPTPQNFNDYAVASTAEQKRLYPLAQPRLVSQEMSDTIGAAVGKITNTPEGAAASAQILSSYARTTGSYWPQMTQELYHNKVLNPLQTTAAMLYGKPNGTALAEEILRTSVIPDKELAAKNEGNVNVTDVKARAAANRAFAPLARTLRDDRSPDSIVGAYEKSLTSVMLNRGDASSATAASLASKMINDEYTFKGDYRVPNSAKVNADDVDAGLKSALGRVTDATSGINGANLIIPPSYSGLGPNDQKRAYVANVQAQGHWVTNSTETGAVLYDEQNHPVWQTGKNGKPQMVGLNWSDAANAGVAARGITGKAYKFIWGQPQAAAEEGSPEAGLAASKNPSGQGSEDIDSADH